MNPLLVMALASGLLVGLGITVGTAGIVGRRHPDLGQALAALDERTPPPPPPQPWTRIAARSLVRRLPGRVPVEDLELLGWGTDRFVLGRAGAALGYAAAGPVLAGVLTVLDVGLPLVMPTGVTIAAAVAGWTSHTRRVEQRAEDAVTEMRYTIVSYLQQVSLLRRGGAGAATALTLPAQLLADSWGMRRIRQELDRAERSGQMPWDGLRRLGEQTGVTELADLSSIAATAGQDGGAVIDTLLARAESLQEELLADEHEVARRASTQMSTPGVLQVVLIVAWVLYPAGVALLGA